MTIHLLQDIIFPGKNISNISKEVFFFSCFFIGIIKNKKGKKENHTTKIYGKVRKAGENENLKMKLILILAPLNYGPG